MREGWAACAAADERRVRSQACHKRRAQGLTLRYPNQTVQASDYADSASQPIRSWRTSLGNDPIALPLAMLDDEIQNLWRR